MLYKDQIVLFPRYHTDAQYGDFHIRKVRPNMQYMHRSIDGYFSFTSNNKGFRNVEDIKYEKDSDELRVLCLGDPHTLGYEVNRNETYASQLQSLMVSAGVKGRVINAGVFGFSTSEELILLENEGYRYDPDFVVLGFFANDFQDNVQANLFELNGDSLTLVNHEYIPGVKIQNFIYRSSLIQFLGENSYLYAFTFNAIWEIFKDVSAQEASSDEVAVMSEDEEFSSSEKALMRALISRLYHFCKIKEIPLIIIDVPTHDLESSVPEDMVSFFRDHSDALLYYKDLKPEYDKLNLTHV